MTGITLTKRAAEEVHSIVEEQKLDKNKTLLRIGCKGGGCSGFTYILDLTKTRKDTDEEFECHGITVICDHKSLLYLNGTSIDFKEDLMGRGFVFNNPGSSGQCGCGSSFSV